jgi:hypothetical protein
MQKDMRIGIVLIGLVLMIMTIVGFQDMSFNFPDAEYLFLENKINELESKEFQIEFDNLMFQERKQSSSITIWEEILGWNPFLEKIQQIKMNNDEKVIIWICRKDMIVWVQENEKKAYFNFLKK